jgi:hypothetical protein
MLPSHLRLRGADMPVSRSTPRPMLAINYHDGPLVRPVEEVDADSGLPPLGATRVLLHSCCAPCSGAMFEEMRAKGLDITVFFYNPNIHPRAEYLRITIVECPCC